MSKLIDLKFLKNYFNDDKTLFMCKGTAYDEFLANWESIEILGLDSQHLPKKTEGKISFLSMTLSELIDLENKGVKVFVTEEYSKFLSASIL